jgi:hypothetical protein
MKALPAIFLLSACSPVMNDSAVCDGLSRFVDQHNEALVESPHVPSVITGAALISAYDAGCAN